MHGIVMFFAALVINAVACAGARDCRVSSGLKKTPGQGSLNAMTEPGNIEVP